MPPGGGSCDTALTESILGQQDRESSRVRLHGTLAVRTSHSNDRSGTHRRALPGLAREHRKWRNVESAVVYCPIVPRRRTLQTVVRMRVQAVRLSCCRRVALLEERARTGVDSTRPRLF